MKKELNCTDHTENTSLLKFKLSNDKNSEEFIVEVNVKKNDILSLVLGNQFEKFTMQNLIPYQYKEDGVVCPNKEKEFFETINNKSFYQDNGDMWEIMQNNLEERTKE